MSKRADDAYAGISRKEQWEIKKRSRKNFLKKAMARGIPKVEAAMFFDAELEREWQEILLTEPMEYTPEDAN